MAKPANVEVAALTWRPGYLLVEVHIKGEVRPGDKEPRTARVVEQHEFFEALPPTEKAASPRWHDLPPDLRGKGRALQQAVEATIEKYL